MNYPCRREPRGSMASWSGQSLTALDYVFGRGVRLTKEKQTPKQFLSLHPGRSNNLEIRVYRGAGKRTWGLVLPFDISDAGEGRRRTGLCV